MAGGQLVSDSGDTLEVPQGSFTSTITISMLTAKPSASSSFSGTVGSNYVTIAPATFPLAPGRTVHLMVHYDDKVLTIPQLYRSDSGIQGSWAKVDNAEYSHGYAEADVTQGGTYVVQTNVNWGAVIGIIIGAVAIVGALIGYMYYRYRTGGKGVDSSAGSKAAVPVV